MNSKSQQRKNRRVIHSTRAARISCLAAIGVGAGIGHGQKTGLDVLELNTRYSFIMVQRKGGISRVEGMARGGG